MKFNEIPKFVVNLEKRTDRLEFIKKEMEYIGWEFELFKGYDVDSYHGITLAHLDIIDIAEKNGYDNVMIIEDDHTFMPYAKSLLSILEEELSNIEFGFLNLSPTLNRPVNISEKSKYLLDLTNLPDRLPHHSGIYGANMVVYNKSSFDLLRNIKEKNLVTYYAVDQHHDNRVLPNIQSYSPILPIGAQCYGWSNISHGDYNNWYLQTYNFNGYSPYKIPNEYIDFTRVQEMKINNQHYEFNYVS
jgi:hypothetical protein